MSKVSLEEKKEILKDKSIFQIPDESTELAELHSELIDAFLGSRIPDIENAFFLQAKKSLPEGNVTSWGRNLHQNQQTWVGLHPQTLQTPYTEISRMVELGAILPGDHVVDLGAGYGRLGLTLHHIIPNIFFSGFEYVPERVEEARRLFSDFACQQASMTQADLSTDEFVLPEADVYVIYDFGRIDIIKKILSKIKEVAKKRPIRLIGRGNASRSIIHYQHPWLTDIEPPTHEHNFSIYYSYIKQSA